jgi:PAS domain S-box-containing protein
VREGGDWRVMQPGQASTDNRRDNLLASRDGGMWVADQRGVVKWRGGSTVQTNEFDEPFRGAAPYHLLEDRTGNLWVGSFNRGLRIYTGDGRILRFTRQEGLSHDAVRALFEDREGNVWAGTDGGGLVRFKRRTFEVFGEPQGLTQNIINSVSEPAPGRLLVATHGGGLLEWDASSGKFSPPITTTNRALGAESTITAAWRDRKGVTWTAIYGRGLFRLIDGSLESVPRSEVPARNIYVLHEDPSGRLWIGADSGLASHLDGVFTRHGTNEGIPRSRVMAITADAQGSVWLSVRTNLFRQRGERFEEVPFNHLNEYDRVLSLHPDPDGSLWLGTFYGGLGRLENGKFFWFREPQGLPRASIGSILDDGHGFLWLGTTQHGAWRVKRASLLAVAAGRASRIELLRFNKSDGLPTTELRFGVQPVAARLSDGRLCFATLKGLALVNPARVGVNRQTPPVRIESIVVDGREVSDGTPALKSLSLPPGTKRLQIHYTAPSLTAPEKVRFEYRLAGLDKNWVEAGTERVAGFSDLSPGRYTFHVRAANNDGVWNEAGASIELIQTPFLWQIGWVRTLGFVLLAGAFGGVVWAVLRIRIRRQAEQLREAEARRQSEARHQAILEAIPDMMFRLSRDGTYLDFSASHDETFIPRDKIIGSNVRNAGFPESMVQMELAAIARALDTGRTQTIEYSLPMSDGVRHYEARFVRSGPDEVVAIARDVTSRKHTEEEVRELNSYLERRVTERTEQLATANRELEAFSYSVSHDLRAPLRHVSGFTGMLLQSPSIAKDEHARRLASHAEAAARRMGELIDNLLSFSRMGREPMKSERVPLHRLVEEVREELHDVIGSRHIEWKIAPLPEVTGDPAMLRQVISNLLQNAVKYTRTRAIAVIEVGARAEGQEIVVFVRDNGVGFDMDYVGKLFGVFARLHSDEEFEGTGIGLANVRRIITRMGGRTWAEGRVDDGATIYFSLPREVRQP